MCAISPVQKNSTVSPGSRTKFSGKKSKSRTSTVCSVGAFVTIKLLISQNGVQSGTLTVVVAVHAASSASVRVISASCPAPDKVISNVVVPVA